MTSPLKMADGQNPRTKSGELTATQQRYVQARLTSKSVADASKTVGIHERTGRRYEHDPRVIQALRQARAEALADVTGSAIGVMHDAFPQLAEIAKDKTIAPSTRVAAWRAILDAGARFVETNDFAERLIELERRLNA